MNASAAILSARSADTQRTIAVSSRVALDFSHIRTLSPIAAMHSPHACREPGQDHNCDFDHKGRGREILAKNNPNISIKGGFAIVQMLVIHELCGSSVLSAVCRWCSCCLTRSVADAGLGLGLRATPATTTWPWADPLSTFVCESASFYSLFTSDWGLSRFQKLHRNCTVAIRPCVVHRIQGSRQG